jgi:hypothetical protein
MGAGLSLSLRRHDHVTTHSVAIIHNDRGVGRSRSIGDNAIASHEKLPGTAIARSASGSWQEVQDRSDHGSGSARAATYVLGHCLHARHSRIPNYETV